MCAPSAVDRPKKGRMFTPGSCGRHAAPIHLMRGGMDLLTIVGLVVGAVVVPCLVAFLFGPFRTR